MGTLQTTRLSTELIDKITDIISRTGVYLDTALDYIGVPRFLAYRWLAIAKKELDTLSQSKRRTAPTKKHRLHVQFLYAIHKAIATASISALATVVKSAKGFQVEEKHVRYDADGDVIDRKIITKNIVPDWKASAWLLEHRIPEMWHISQDEYPESNILSLTSVSADSDKPASEMTAIEWNEKLATLRAKADELELGNAPK